MNYLHYKTKAKYFTLAALLLFLMVQFSWKTTEDKFNSQIISGDGAGYYQYLVNYFYNETIDKQALNSNFMLPYGERVVNKCFVGAAVCMSPFYKLAEWHSDVLNEKFDPYSPRTKKWINVGSLFYLFFAFFLISKWLSVLAFRENTIFWSIASFALGSNLFLYSVLSPSMTHVYSFFAIAAFSYFATQFFRKLSGRSFYLSTFFLGLILIIRPVNGLILILLPLLAGNWNNLLNAVKSLSFTKWVVGFFTGFIPILIQCYLWKLQTGDWIVWSYGEEGFNWGSPQIAEVLFGFRKGWFVYTPLVLVSMFGLVAVYKKSKLQFYNIVVFLLVLIYIVASWWNWFYGSSFGQRPFVDFYALFILLLAFVLQAFSLQKLGKVLLKIIIVGLVGLNLFQSYQYKENLISSWDMNFDKYVATLGVTEPHQVKIGGSRSILPYHAQKELLFDSLLLPASAIEPQKVNELDVFDYSGKEYSTSLKYLLKDCAETSRGYYLELELSRLELETNSSENAKVIVEVKDEKGEVNYYSWFLINETPADIANEWRTYSYQVMLPKCTTSNSKFHVYLRNEDLASFLISDVRVQLFDIY